MRSNSLDKVFGFTCFGESHGPAMGIVIEDVLPGVEFPYTELSRQLTFRKPNQTAYTSTRNEEDDFQIISGVMDGKTTGTPICILFWNNDIKSSDYEAVKNIFRPGHGDYSWYQKFKIYDYRGGGRSSGRETISRVAASVFVDKLLDKIRIGFQTIRIGLLTAPETDVYLLISRENPFCWNEASGFVDLHNYLDSIEAEHDTVGGIIRLRIDNVPAGLGDPVFAKLSSNLAQAIMSIGSIKGISIGDGFAISSLRGSEANDMADESGWLSNHAGGIVGGISNGQPIILTIAVKPIPSHGREQLSFDNEGNPVTIQITGRHDICHIPRLLPVIEAMVKLTLADAVSHQKLIAGEAQNLDNFREAVDKLDEDLLLTLFKRKALVDKVKAYKSAHNIDFIDPGREQSLAERWQQIAAELNLDKTITINLLQMILEICRK